MDPVSMDICLEEREEGEIVDDLEDVSDCSMSSGSPLFSGKSVSPPELLSAVCLSSISTSEYSTTDGRSCMRDSTYTRHHDRKEVRHRVSKRRRKSEDHVSKRRCYKRTKHYRKSLESTDTDSEDEIVDPKYARKLRVALRRESNHELLHNSLKTRLKAFIEPDSQSEDDLSLATLRELAFATLKNAENTNKQESNLESEVEKPPSEHVEVKDIQDEDEISDIEPPELEQIPIVLDSKDVVEKEKDDTTCKADDTICQNTVTTVQVPENGDDSDLNELRLAALKTVIMEKHKRRKRKMALQNVNNDNECKENVNKNEENGIDKENDGSMINNDLDGKTNTNKNLNCDLEKDNDIVNKEQTTNNLADVNNKHVDDDNCFDCVDKVEIEEDADILRAVLLASMTQKLADKTSENNSSSLLGGLTLSGIRKVEKSKANHNSFTVTIGKPKPLLRTIKNDIYRTTNTNHMNNLKINKINEQPHCVVKPLIINVNNDSDSDTENLENENSQSLKATVTEFLKKQRAEVEAGKVKLSENSETSLNKSDDVLTEKSVVKLLPRSQQIEYRRLKQLLNARKKTRIRRHSLKLSESKREKVPKVKTDASTNASENTKSSTNIVEKKNTQPSSNLQETLNDMQIRKNGRLQMKGKYRSLDPLLNRIKQASNERQQHETEIKKLLQQIEKARMKLAASHQNFTNLVQQLLSEKSKIDKRIFKMVKPAQSNIFTSTPNKFVKRVPLTNTNCSKEKNCAVANGTIENNCPEESKKEPDNKVDQLPQIKDTKEEIFPKLEQDEVLLDPNDVNKVFVEQPLMELVTFPKYTSPLDNRDGINDPLTTLCPYDLLGVCKDKDCRYMHCS